MSSKNLILLSLVAVLAAACGDDASNLQYPPFPTPTGAPDAGPRPDGSMNPPPVQPLVINEVVIDNVGGDVLEYVEVFGEPNTDYSDFTLLILEGDTTANEGTVTIAEALGTSDANGFILIEPGTLQNGSQTFVLVDTFAGAVNDDLDTDDDGVLDTTPWDAVQDIVALGDEEYFTSGCDQAPATDGDRLYITIGTASISAGLCRPDNPTDVGGASRIPNGIDTNSAGNWVMNAIGGVASDNTQAGNTPGASNCVGGSGVCGTDPKA